MKLNCENQGCKFRQGNGAIAARWQAKAGVEPPFAGWERPFSLREVALRKTNCVRFGRIASLSAFVQFAGGCLFLNYFSIFLRFQFVRSFYVFRMANSIFFVPLRFQISLINTFVKGDSLSPIFRGCLALLSLRDISPHCGESSLSAELSQLDRSCLRLISCNPYQIMPSIDS